MATTQELRDQRANAWALAQEYNARTEMTAEDDAAWQRALDDVDRLTVSIENRERNEKMGASFSEIDEQRAEQREDAARRGNLGPVEQQARDYEVAFIAFCRDGMSGLTPEQAQILRTGTIDPAQSRAMGVGTGSAGGYTVPQGFWAKVTESMLFYANLMPLSDQLTTESGQQIPWPTWNDTANEGALLAENTQAGEQDVVSGQAILDAYMYTSKIIRLSYQLLQDNGVDIENRIAGVMGQRLGRIVNRHFTVGTGSSQPQGYVTGSTVGKTANAVAAVTYDELVDLQHSVDAAYRDGGNCRWMYHDLTLASIRKLKDDDNRPLWEPSVQAGAPSTFLGSPYSINNYMAQLVASAKTIAYGDFRAGFATRRVTQGAMKRLEERYADFAQVGFIGFGRYDSVVQDTSAIKLLQQAAS